MTDELIERLREAAKEIASEDHNGWGNTCTEAADLIESQAAEIERLSRNYKRDCETYRVERDSLQARVAELEEVLTDIATYSTLDPDGFNGIDAESMQDAAMAALTDQEG